MRDGAIACPHCGADDETGWSEDAEYDDVDLPDEAFGDPPRPTRQRSQAFTFVVILLMIVIFFVWIVGGF